MADTGYIAQGWMMLAQRTEPTEEMGIAAELRESPNLMGEGHTETGEEGAYG